VSTRVVSRIYINPSERVIGMLGVTAEFAAGAYADDDSHVYGLRDNPEKFTWSSSDPKVATVAGAAVTSVGEGTATITVAVEGVTRSVPVIVRDRARFAWSVPIPGGITVGNVMGADGTIYVGSEDRVRETTTWYAVSPLGSIVWTLDLPLTEQQLPAIGADGTLYLASTSLREPIKGSLIAVDPHGSVRWTLKGLDERTPSFPALAPDGTIYVVGESRVYAVDPRGEIRWTWVAGNQEIFRFSAPAVAHDGTIYVSGPMNERLYAINPDGSLRWTFQLSAGKITSDPSIGSDGTIYFGTGGPARLHAMRPDGTERWSVVLSSEPFASVEGSPSIGADGTIYVQAKSGLYAVDPNGSIRWSAPGVGRDWGTPILGADGTVYVVGLAPPGRWGIYALDLQGRRLGDYLKSVDWRLEIRSPAWPIIGLDGTIIVAAGDELIAVVEHRPTNGGYAASPWPQARGDRANSGRARR
jgi:outer membrane protein assembly factor BamB